MLSPYVHSLSHRFTSNQPAGLLIGIFVSSQIHTTKERGPILKTCASPGKLSLETARRTAALRVLPEGHFRELLVAVLSAAPH